MRRWTLVFAGVLLSCAPGPRPSPSDVPRQSAAPTADWVDATLAAMSLRDKAAQLVWPWILGDYVPEGSAEWGRIQRLVTEDRVGGFIVSVGSPLDIAVKVNALQRLSAVPLLMSADMETGAGFRARGGFFTPNGIDLGGATVLPLQMAFGAARDTSLAYEAGRITAREARALGIHIAYGPVLDVNNNPLNPVIGARAFSDDAGLTAKLGSAWVRGLQEHGVLATGKHFPGHGDTETNSHLALSVVTASRARLDSMELVPFREVIQSGVGAIMTFHGFLPALDSSGVPATLSPRVMTELLRRDLQFQGLLITDAMDMRGVIDQFGAVEAMKRAIAAGNDVLLMPTDTRGAIDAILAGIREGRYDEARLTASVRRVLELKVRFGLHDRRLVDLDSVRSIVGDSMHTALAERAAQRGLVLARDRAALVPLRTQGKRVLVVTYARRNDLGAGLRFNAELRRGAPNVRTLYLNADDEAPQLDRVQRAADSADVVIVANYVNITSESATADAPRAFTQFVDQLSTRHQGVIVISFGTPYLLQQVPSVGTYMIAWGGATASQLAAARALTGRASITGTMPIAIPGLLVRGAGEMRSGVTPDN